MTIHEAQQKLLFQLYHVYDEREALNISNMVMEHLTEWTRIDRILNKNATLSTQKLELYHHYTEQLLQHKPVQYVLQEAWFAGFKFYVDENVLIPRPETDELVDWIIKDIKSMPEVSVNVLDIGTGSGCIPISIKKKLPTTKVHACDISAGALTVAKKNSLGLGAPVNFHELNFLDETERNRLPVFDIIISNPPYIPKKDIATMDKNVVNYEPHLALFVEDDDAFIFYKAIADFATNHLAKSGVIYLEMHEGLSTEVLNLYETLGFHDIELRKDLQGKNRMMRISKLAD